MTGYPIADVFLICMFAVIGLFSIASCLERKDWNNGQCRVCGERWEQFDTDSQGGRGYKDLNGHSIWISYPVDRVRPDPCDMPFQENREF